MNTQIAQIGNAQVDLRHSKGSWYGVFVNDVLWGDKVQGEVKGQALFNEVCTQLTATQAHMQVPSSVLTPSGMLSREMAQWTASMLMVKATAYADATKQSVENLDGGALYQAILGDAIYAALLYAALRSIGKVQNPDEIKSAKRPEKWVRPGGAQWERLRRKLVAYIQSTCQGIAREGSTNALWRF